VDKVRQSVRSQGEIAGCLIGTKLVMSEVSFMAGEEILKLHQVERRIEATRCKLRESSFVDVDMSGASFRDVNLTGMTVHDVNLSNARLDDVNLSGLVIKDADMRGATLSECLMEGMMLDGIPVIELLKLYRAAQQK